MMQLFDARWSKVDKDFFHLATVLDPRYYNEKGSPLSENQMYGANEFFEEYLRLHDFNIEEQSEITLTYSNYKRKTGYFANKKMDGCPIIFWLQFLDYNRGTYNYKSYKGLALLAIKLLSICPHSCDCERMHSVHKCIQTKYRNRMTIEKCQKLLRCKSYLMNNEDYKAFMKVDSNRNDNSIIDFVHYTENIEEDEVELSHLEEQPFIDLWLTDELLDCQNESDGIICRTDQNECIMVMPDSYTEQDNVAFDGTQGLE